jgi:hypothetical protein
VVHHHYLPNPDRAVVEVTKVRDYLLSHDHPVGRHKAVVFEAAGYHHGQWERLHVDLLQTAWMVTQAPIKTPFGLQYRTNAILLASGGRRLPVCVLWLVRAGEDYPRFVTAYPRRPHAV